MEVEHALAVGFRLRRRVLLAQLGLDHLDLLAQIVFALVFVHLGLELILYFVFDLEDLGLLTQQPDHHSQAAGDVQFLEDLLLGVDLDRQVLRDVVCQPARVSTLSNRQLHVRRNARRILRIFGKALLRGADERLRTALGHAVHKILQLLDLSIDAAVLFLGHGELVGQCTRTALYQHTDVIARQAQDLPHHAHCTHLVKVARRGRAGLEFPLRGQKNQLPVLHRRLERADGHHAADVEMDDHVGKRRQPAQRQHRQPAERRFVCFYHSSSPHVRKSLNSVSIVYFPQFVKRHPTMIL